MEMLFKNLGSMDRKWHCILFSHLKQSEIWQPWYKWQIKKLKLFKMKSLIKALKWTNRKVRTFILYYMLHCISKVQIKRQIRIDFPILDRQLLNFFDIKYNIKVIGNPQKLLMFQRDFFFYLFCFLPFFLSSKWETTNPTNHERSIQILNIESPVTVSQLKSTWEKHS